MTGGRSPPARAGAAIVLYYGLSALVHYDALDRALSTFKATRDAPARSRRTSSDRAPDPIRSPSTLTAREESTVALERCIFCEPEREILAQNAHAIAVPDSFPVTPGHTLILPRRHVATIWDLDPDEYADCFALARNLRPILESRFSPDGFNVGANCGEAAGQSVWHAHIHVIPRYKGDTPDPRGGVRHVIPLKGNY